PVNAILPPPKILDVLSLPQEENQTIKKPQKTWPPLERDEGLFLMLEIIIVLLILLILLLAIFLYLRYFRKRKEIESPPPSHLSENARKKRRKRH
ncbi:MAG: hypothetical protein ABIH83_00665, partial [Candidatus Micrarchaeota archaeon]